MELSPEIDADVEVQAAAGASSGDMPVLHSDPCLPSAASELGISDGEAAGAAVSSDSADGAPRLPAAEPSEPATTVAAHEHMPGGTMLPADSDLMAEGRVDGDTHSPHADQPGTGAVRSCELAASVSRQSSRLSHASAQAAAEPVLESGAAAAPAGSAARTDVSDADASDGAAALSDPHNSLSAATPDTSADEGAIVDDASLEAPVAMPSSQDLWPPQATEPASGSPMAASVASAVSGGIASGTGFEAGPPGATQRAPPQAHAAGVAVGESVRKVAWHSGSGDVEDDTATTCSDDMRSMMSTVGVPSDIGTPVGSSSGGARVSQTSLTVPDVLHPDPAQAALLNLHMLGKSKCIKKGSYLISTDGAVVRTKKRPS